MFDNFGVNSAKPTFKGFSEKHRMIKLNEFLSLPEGNTISGRFSNDWTKPFEGIKMPQRTQDCVGCKND